MAENEDDNIEHDEEFEDNKGEQLENVIQGELNKDLELRMWYEDEITKYEQSIAWKRLIVIIFLFWIDFWIFLLFNIIQCIHKF